MACRALACAALALPLVLAAAHPVAAEEPADTGDAQEAGEQSEESEFIGRYDGNSFETAMGMVIRADGTFAWGLSVGALDMRAQGTWHQTGQMITLTSNPVPVAPEFGWSGYETTPDGPLIRVVWATNGRPFQYASAKLTCADGSIIFGQVYNEGWSPPEGECDEPVSVQLKQDIHNVTSETYDIAETFNPGEGGTVRFEFRPNDMGVADFTGMTGGLADGVLFLHGGEWPMELRKVESE